MPARTPYRIDSLLSFTKMRSPFSLSPPSPLRPKARFNPHLPAGGPALSPKNKDFSPLSPPFFLRRARLPPFLYPPGNDPERPPFLGSVTMRIYGDFSLSGNSPPLLRHLFPPVVRIPFPRRKSAFSPLRRRTGPLFIANHAPSNSDDAPFFVNDSAGMVEFLGLFSSAPIAISIFCGTG